MKQIKQGFKYSVKLSLTNFTIIYVILASNTSTVDLINLLTLSWPNLTYPFSTSLIEPFFPFPSNRWAEKNKGRREWGGEERSKILLHMFCITKKTPQSFYKIFLIDSFFTCQP